MIATFSAAHMCGVAAVVIEAAEYEALVALRDGRSATGRRVRLSRLDRDPEVRDFVDARIAS